MKIALLQILPTGSLNGNREKGVEACRKAKVLGADIALFPEMWSNGYDIPEDAEVLQRAAVPADGEFVSGFGKLAAELNMAIAITFLEKTEKRPRNAVSLFDRHGRRLYTYAKVHTCDFGDECRLDAGEDFFVASLDTEEGTVQVGSMICYDREFPESARILMLKGAELILTPNACPMEINRLSQLRGRAYENMTAIATCNYPSPHPDCNGHSTVFDGVAYLPEHLYSGGGGGQRDLSGRAGYGHAAGIPEAGGSRQRLPPPGKVRDSHGNGDSGAVHPGRPSERML